MITETQIVHGFAAAVGIDIPRGDTLPAHTLIPALNDLCKLTRMGDRGGRFSNPLLEKYRRAVDEQHAMRKSPIGDPESWLWDRFERSAKLLR